MKYIDLCGVYEGLNSTSKRLEKTDIIRGFLENLPDNNTDIIILLLQGRLFPQWEEQKIGVAAKTVLKAINVSTGISMDKIEQEWKKTGDLGLVAENLTGKKQQATLYSQDLEIDMVYSNLIKLATMEGHGTVDRRIKMISQLLTSAKPIEAKYIVRTVLEDMRIGVGDGTIRDAIVWAFFSEELGEGEDSAKLVSMIGETKVETHIELKGEGRERYNQYCNHTQMAYNLTNDFAQVIRIAKKDGIEGLKNKEMEVGKPIKVMLYPKAKDVKDAFKIVGKPAAFEYKYDGFRVQIHYNRGEVELYTRRLERVTKQFPDVVKVAKENIKAETAILDSEVVGYNPKTNQYLPFQSISQRIKRKHNIEEMTKKFPVEINVFDIVYHNGESLLEKPFHERRGLITKIVEPETRKIVLSRIIITDNDDKATEFYNEALDMGEEGVMAKKLDAGYEPGARVGNGVKLKQVMDGLDLVIVGAEWGEGKRASWLTSFTLATLDENNEYVEIGKVSTGLKELEGEGTTFTEMTQLLQPLIIGEKGKEVKVKPHVVIEVHYEEIQASKTYESGYALRFPRFVRLRDDRRADEINNIYDIEDLYKTQRNR